MGKVRRKKIIIKVTMRDWPDVCVHAAVVIGETILKHSNPYECFVHHLPLPCRGRKMEQQNLSIGFCCEVPSGGDTETERD